VKIRQGFAIRLDFGHGTRIVAEVVVDDGPLVVIDGIERVHGEQIFDLGRPAFVHG
jgi:hypothetical protein